MAEFLGWHLTAEELAMQPTSRRLSFMFLKEMMVYGDENYARDRL
jgi:hypothetical protein